MSTLSLAAKSDAQRQNLVLTLRDKTRRRHSPGDNRSLRLSAQTKRVRHTSLYESPPLLSQRSRVKRRAKGLATESEMYRTLSCNRSVVCVTGLW